MTAKQLIEELVKLTPETEILIEEKSKYSTVVRPVDRIEPEGCNQLRQIIKG